MKIRKAERSDIPGIIDVLKASLGEVSSKKTGVVWNFKHQNNPFGESLVLVAEDHEKIVGVRAFMRWQWKKGKVNYSAFRAVDTATHPDYQGKGIFKKLTLEALQVGKKNGDHFVFNTPNQQSKPGYLKMGWKEIDKVFIHIIPIPSFFIRSKKVQEQYSIELNESGDLFHKWDYLLSKRDIIYTPKNEEFLRWRYFNNPMQKYLIASTKNYFIASYVKYHRGLKELRVSELILVEPRYQLICKNIIKSWARENKVHIISIHAPLNENIFKYKVAGKFGPVLTFKELENPNMDMEFYSIKNWAYSLGDLELF